MKKIINAILTFLLIILVFGLTILVITKQTILNEQFVMKKIESISYYEKITNSLRESFKNNIIQSGIEVEFADRLVDENKIKNDINGVIHSIYSGTDYKVTTNELTDKLNTRIDEIFDERNVVKTKSDEQSIVEFLDIISDTYITEINIISGSHDILNKVVNKVNSYLPVLSIVLAVSIGLIFIIMLVINKNIKFLSITFLANALLLLVIYAFVHYNTNIENVKIFTDEFSLLLRAIMNGYVNIYLYASIAYFVFGLGNTIFTMDAEKKY